MVTLPFVCDATHCLPMQRPLSLKVSSRSATGCTGECTWSAGVVCWLAWVLGIVEKPHLHMGSTA